MDSRRAVRTVQVMDRLGVLLRAAGRGVGDALWSLRWAGVSLSGRAKAVFVTVLVALPVLAFVGVVLLVQRGPAAHAPAPAAPVSAPTPAKLQEALDALGPVTRSEAVDGPKCRAAAKRVKSLTQGASAASAGKDVVEEVGFQAAVVGRFCDAKTAAKVNRDQLVPFYDSAASTR